MRTLLLASASVLLLGGAALAQNSNSPLSTSAAHTDTGNTKGAMAPRLPVPAQDASIDQFLNHAQTALRRGRTGEAQEALERAETRALSRSTDAGTAGTPDSDPKVAAIASARKSLGSGDRKGAMQSIQTALATSSTGAMPAGGEAMPMPQSGTETGPGMTGTFTGPAPAAGVKPGTLGGISNSVGGAGGSGGNQRRPAASYSGPATPPPPILPDTGTAVPAPAGTTPSQ